jgi:hypothetical protein
VRLRFPGGSGRIAVEWLALGRRVEELKLVEPQHALVDLSALLARAYDFDHVTERRDDEHLNGLRKYRPADDNALPQVTRVHLNPAQLRYDPRPSSRSSLGRDAPCDLL